MCELPESLSHLPGLSPDEVLVWSGFNLVHATVMRRLDTALRAAHGLPLSDCEILLWVSRPTCQHMRLAALADLVRLSPSGLSRAIERLEGRGLVNRLRAEEDRRGAFAKLTSAGCTLTAQIAATMAEGVRAGMLAEMTPEEMATFRQVWRRMLAHDGQACPSTQLPSGEEHW